MTEGDAERRTLYCQRCGGPTGEREVDGRRRPVCDICGAVTYLDPKLAVAVVIGRAGRVLLGLRAAHTRNPGLWSFPAGFVDRGEKVESAAIREAREESGLDVRLDHLLDVVSAEGEPVVLLAYAAEPLDPTAEPVAGDDLIDVRWFACDALPALAFPHDARILSAWQDRGRLTIQR
jgi:8-oxo-dGTP pyrophosphatase MutT (NUDIX family)